MSAISLKSITGITSITTPAGVDNPVIVSEVLEPPQPVKKTIDSNIINTFGFIMVMCRFEPSIYPYV